MLTVQQKAAKLKLTRKTWRRVAEMKLACLYPTKVRKQPQPNRVRGTCEIRNGMEKNGINWGMR